MAAKIDAREEDSEEPMIKKTAEELIHMESVKKVRFWTLVVGIIFFFGCHNYLQERIMTLPGFKVK